MNMNMTTWQMRIGRRLAAVVLAGGMMGSGLSPAQGAEPGKPAAERSAESTGIREGAGDSTAALPVFNRAPLRAKPNR